MSGYVYVRSEPGLFTVGFYTPDGKWESESDHNESAAAAERVGALNGAASGTAAANVLAQIAQLLDGTEWDSGMLAQIAEWCRGQGLQIRDPADVKVFCGVCGEEHSPPECNDDFPEPGDIRETGK